MTIRRDKSLPITEAALIVGCSPEAIYRMVRLRKIRATQTKPMRVNIDDVVRVLGRN